MELLIVFCSTEPCESALEAYSDIVQKEPNTGIAVMDFSRKADIELKNEDSLQYIKNRYGIPTYFWRQIHTDELISALKSVSLPVNIISLMGRNDLDYGWMRNKATLLALVAGAEAIQSFDIDTIPTKYYPDILQVHKHLLHKPIMGVVSGNYLGPRAVTTSMFHSVNDQIGFLGLIKQATGFDVLNPPIVGGAMSINMKFAKIAPFPLLVETTMSDDLFASYLAKLLDFNVQQSSELVEHQHGGKLDPERRPKVGRPDPVWTQRYFKRILRITSLMTCVRDPRVEQELKKALNHKDYNAISSFYGINPCIDAIGNVLARLTSLATHQKLLLAAIHDLEKPNVINEIAKETIEGVDNYLEFITYWPVIHEQAMKKGAKWVEIP